MTGNRFPLSRQSLELGLRGVRVDRGVDRLQVARDLLTLAPRDVFEAVTDQVHDARLHDRLRVDRLDRFGEPLQPVDAADQDVLNAALLEIGSTCIQNFAPSLAWNHIPSTSRSPSIATPSAR